MRHELSGRDVQAREEETGQQESQRWRMEVTGEADPGEDPLEVVIGISPGFGVRVHKTTGGVPLSKVLAALLEGIREGGGHSRVVRVYHTADTSFLGLTAARLAGSRIGIGIQGKGTTVIDGRDQAPHMNLELFSQAPLIRSRIIERSAATPSGTHWAGPLPQ